MWETYFTPATLDEAFQLLAEHGESARIIAGGTDIIIELERGIRSNITTLIDITRIPGLDRIELGQDGSIHIGPLATHNHIAGSQLLVDRALPLAQASWLEAAPQIRNRATLAGNLITASPANDTITPLMALKDAQVTLRSRRGERVVPLEDFYTGVRRTIMQPDELLTDVSFRPLDPGERGIFLKLGLRRAQAISVVNVVVVLRFEGEIISEARITEGSVAPTIIHAPEAEAALIGGPLPGIINTAAELAASCPARYYEVQPLIGRDDPCAYPAGSHSSS
jgi:carbon-monoxide dehydrogenase medium subunit